MKDIESNYHKYWNRSKDYYQGNKIPRKAKKFVKNRIKDKWLPSVEEHRWCKLQDCKWCDGSGTIREQMYDTGYSCPDCEGKGKTGWKYDKNGSMVDNITGLKVEVF